jgi:hypothetical protein
MHFNFNLQQELDTRKADNQNIKITYTKFKNGRAAKLPLKKELIPITITCFKM